MHCKSWRNCACWVRRCLRAEHRWRQSSLPTQRRCRRGAIRPAFTTRQCVPPWRRSPQRWASARAPTPCARPSRRPGLACPPFPPPPSARFRRPQKSAMRAVNSRQVGSIRKATRPPCAPRLRAACANRKRWTWTYSCTARPSATTWSNTLANNSTAMPSASLAGCSPMVRAA
ncbi:hypothetical protein D3C71_1707310 [compost metagenome]